MHTVKMPNAGPRVAMVPAVGSVVSIIRAFQAGLPACIQSACLAMAGRMGSSGSSAAKTSERVSQPVAWRWLAQAAARAVYCAWVQVW